MAVKKRCQYCGRFFVPDKRIGDRRKACSAACQKLRKRDNNRSFSRSNPGYWRGRYGEVKQWRQEHPVYQRQWRQARAQRLKTMKRAAIQAELFARALDNVDKNVHLLFKIQAEIGRIHSEDQCDATPLRQEAQVDWMHFRLPDGVMRFGFVFILCYSRYLYVRSPCFSRSTSPKRDRSSSIRS